MIIVDTNVISAFTREVPDLDVIKKLDRFSPEPFWTTSITIVELEYGIWKLRDESKRADLRLRTEYMLDSLIRPRVLTLDEVSGRIAGKLRLERERAGRPMQDRDLLMAAIVLAHQATLLTRNLRHFVGCGIELIDPWIL